VSSGPSFAASETLRRGRRLERFLTLLERATLTLERPLQRLVREPQFNPLYHTGPIAVFLLLLVAATGVYLTMFFRFGFVASYEAVARKEIPSCRPGWNVAGRRGPVRRWKTRP
jgi:quinol-cytochrome oxidoreductase complex cytochrome b subunit